ncbi:MAG: right-handed parallel beta-helix repeat-containing protein [Myxococcota bacterium]|nr:right-handed parallel beta-helix repeat-containing protein [Myxococcota bacterium]
MRNLVLLLALSSWACNCEPSSPDLVFDAGTGGNRPTCQGSSVNDPITGRCVRSRGVTSKCPDGAYDESHPWAAEAASLGYATIYVAEGGTGSGSRDEPMGELGAAIERLQERGGAILLGGGNHTITMRPILTKPVTIIGRCAESTVVAGQVRGVWQVAGAGADAALRLSGLDIEMGLRLQDIPNVSLNQVVLKAEAGQRAEVGVHIGMDDAVAANLGVGATLIAAGVEVSFWDTGISATRNLNHLEITGGRLEGLGRAAIQVKHTVEAGHVLIEDNLLTTGEDAEYVVSVGEAGSFGRTVEEKERVVDQFSGTVIIRNNTVRGLPNETEERINDKGAENGIVIRYPRVRPENSIEVSDNVISDNLEAGIWVRQFTESTLGDNLVQTRPDDDTGSWLLANNQIERVGSGVLAERITGALVIRDNVIADTDDRGFGLRNLGANTDLRGNGVNNSRVRGFDIGPFFAEGEITIHSNAAIDIRNTGFNIRADGGGRFELRENEVRGARWGFAFAGQGADDIAAEVSSTTNNVVDASLGYALHRYKGQFESNTDRAQVQGPAWWLERTGGGQAIIVDPALIEARGAAVYAVGNAGAVELRNVVLPVMGASALPFEEGIAEDTAEVETAIVLLDNRVVRVRGVDANLNSVSRALLADRSRAGQDNPYQLDLETGATFEVDDLEGASGAFTKGDLGAINASGNAAGRLEPAGDEAQPRGTTRGAP